MARGRGQGYDRVILGLTNNPVWNAIQGLRHLQRGQRQRVNSKPKGSQKPWSDGLHCVCLKKSEQQLRLREGTGDEGECEATDELMQVRKAHGEEWSSEGVCTAVGAATTEGSEG